MKEKLKSFGYSVTQEKHRLLAGDPDAGHLVAARSSREGAVYALLEMARTMPENQRHKVCFVLFDRCLKGKEDQFVFLLDQIGSGNKMVMIPTNALKKDRKKLTSLYKACGYFGKKSLLVQEKRFHFCLHFPRGVTIRTLEKEDSPLDETNVNILRAALTTYICRTAGE